MHRCTCAVERRASRSFTASAMKESCRPLVAVRGKKASLGSGCADGGDGVLSGFLERGGTALAAGLLRATTSYSA